MSGTMVCSSLSDTSALEAECLVDGESSIPRSLQLASLGREPCCISQGKHDWAPNILNSAISKVEPLSHKWLLGGRREPPTLGCTHQVHLREQKTGGQTKDAKALLLPVKQPFAWKLEREGILCSWLQQFGV